MYARSASNCAWSRGCAAIVACALFAGTALAQGDDVTVAYSVSIKGIDLTTPAGARELYLRLKNAAWVVCTRTNRVGLQPLLDPDACAEKALGEAVRSAHIPQLVQAYLQKHTLAQAAAQGIQVPMQELLTRGEQPAPGMARVSAVAAAPGNPVSR